VRVVVVAVVSAFAVLVAAMLFARASATDDEPAPRVRAKPTYGQLARLVERIDRTREAFAADGIFLEAAGVGDGCAVVSLLNPTVPNVAYVKRRFPGTCVERRPWGIADVCDPTGANSTRNGPVVVPNVRDLGLVEASRRVLAAGLTFTATCLGRARNVEWVSIRPADELVRVVAQCPRAGEHVRRNTEVALQARTVLPGGFDYLVGPPGRCSDRRDGDS
jgi:hypothetical protein